MLNNYFKILKGTSIAKYIISKKISISYNKEDSIEVLWKKHDNAIKNNFISKIKSEKSLLDLKIEISNRILKKCILCERRCKINRNIDIGHCGVRKSKIISEFLHLGEESVLIPSYTIFFSGCNLNCVFCQNWDISQQNNGFFLKYGTVVKMIHNRKKQGAKNINWVGGDPTPNLNYILRVLKNCDVNIPQIWNSNMYCSIETMKLLNGIIDLYLTDFKYGNNNCAIRLSNIYNYFDIVKRNHIHAKKNGDIIIRHLVLPNHYECCSKKIIKWLGLNLQNVPVNIMSQYTPAYQALSYEEISKPLNHNEYFKVKKTADKHNIITI